MSKLRNFALAASAVFGLSSGAALADGPWNGFYVGGLAGYGWGESLHCDGGSTPPCQPGFPNFDIEGGTGGVTIGYNMQHGFWVLGVEGDYSWGSIDGSSGDTGFFGCGGRCATEIESYGTLRARVGRAFNNFLPFVTAGVAISHLSASIGNPVLSSDTETTVSFVGGGGLEMMFLDNWSGKLEGLWISDPSDFNYDTTGACGTPGCFTRDNGFGTVRIGINYHFNHKP